MRFCFSLASAAVLASAIHAAPPGTEGAHAAVVSAIRADPRTGKLVRKVVPPRGAAGAKAPAFGRTVERIAAEQAVPPELLHSVIKVESNYDPYAVSPKGARGLMQLVPSTASRFGVADAFDPAQNIRGGARYLKYLLDLYHGDPVLALAAYNAGEGAVARFGGVPPFVETRQYVKDVGQAFRLAADPGGPQLPPSAAAVPRGPDDDSRGPHPIHRVVESDGSVRYVTQ